jgi:predicted  nucleic acid-binding Zn-ribbon protein
VTLPRLYELQQIDSAIARATARRQALDDGSAGRAALDAARARLDALRAEAEEGAGHMRTRDLEIQSLRAKRTKIEADMYSGRVGNPKELTAMTDEVAALGRYQAQLEDEVLHLMELAETLDAQAAAAAEQLRAAEAELARVVAAFEAAAVETDAEVAALEARRRAHVAEIDEDLLRRYDRLREAKGGLAVVAVRGGVCDGCHVVVPERVVSRLERDPEHLVACDGCGRLLAVPPREGP